MDTDEDMMRLLYVVGDVSYVLVTASPVSFQKEEKGGEVGIEIKKFHHFSCAYQVAQDGTCGAPAPHLPTPTNKCRKAAG